MQNIFLFGTLCWGPLLECVAGRDDLDVKTATLHGYARFWTQQGHFPTVIARDGAAVQGHIIENCPQSVIDRFDFYEGAFDYELATVSVEADAGKCSAKMYFPPKWVSPDREWNLQDWAAGHGPLSVFAAQEVMGYMGRFSPAEIQAKFGMIKSRAAYRLQAGAAPNAPSNSTLSADNVRVNNCQTPYASFFTAQDYNIDVPKFDGGIMAGLDRGVLISSDAAIVLPNDPRRDKVLLVEQFRIGPFARSDKHPWVLEPIAGRIDPYETAPQAAMREMQEKANLQVQKLHNVHQGYASPGSTTDYFNVFVAEVNLKNYETLVGGVESENEDIMPHIFSFDDFHDRLKKSQFPVTPLALAGYWLAVIRDELLAKHKGSS